MTNCLVKNEKNGLSKLPLQPLSSLICFFIKSKSGETLFRPPVVQKLCGSAGDTRTKAHPRSPKAPGSLCNTVEGTLLSQS